MMNSKKAKFISLFFVIILITGLFSVFPVSASGERNMIRVGLKYGSTAVVGANTFAEYGFNIGYYDNNFQFISVFSTDERFLSFARDETIYKYGNDLNLDGRGNVIGGFHVEIGSTFATYDQLSSYLAIVDTTISSVAFPVYADGVYKIRMGAFATADEAASAIANYASYLPSETLTAVGSISKCITIINMNTGRIAYEFEQTGTYPAVIPKQVAGADPILLKHGIIRYYGGFEFKRLNGGNITLISVLNLQQYLMGVICFEMSDSWPVEALKAQAICARGYAVSSFGKHSADGFDICNSTHCQVYKVYSTMEGENTKKAVEETNGMVLTYNGKLADTFYFASTGGYTESNKYVWGGTQYPYLTGVEDKYLLKDFSWKVTKTPSQLSEKSGFAGIVDCKILEYSPNGYVYKLQFTNSSGQTKIITNTDRVRTAVGLNSAFFKLYTIAKLYAANSVNCQSVSTPVEQLYVVGANGVSQLKQSATQLSILSSSGKSKLSADRYSFRFDGAGNGHGIGMSQEGARGMAVNGFTYDKILLHYFQGTQIAVMPELKS